MDKKMALQMMQDCMPQTQNYMSMMHDSMPQGFDDVMELQQLILHYATKANNQHSKDDWAVEMLSAICPKVPEHNRHKVNILIKCMELSQLLKKSNCSDRNGENYGYRCAL